MNRNVRFALAGLETGVTGTLAMLAWFAFGSLWSHRTVWWIPNLFAAIFFGNSSLRFGFARYTLAGFALNIFVYGVVGILFGLIWREQSSGFRAILVGVLLAMLADFLLVRVVWKSMSPMASLYSPDRQILLGHILYGVLLNRFPKVRESLFS